MSVPAPALWEGASWLWRVASESAAVQEATARLLLQASDCGFCFGLHHLFLAFLAGALLWPLLDLLWLIRLAWYRTVIHCSCRLEGLVARLADPPSTTAGFPPSGPASHAARPASLNEAARAQASAAARGGARD